MPKLPNQRFFCQEKVDKNEWISGQTYACLQGKIAD